MPTPLFALLALLACLTFAGLVVLDVPPASRAIVLVALAGVLTAAARVVAAFRK